MIPSRVQTRTGEPVTSNSPEWVFLLFPPASTRLISCRIESSHLMPLLWIERSPSFIESSILKEMKFMKLHDTCHPDPTTSTGPGFSIQSRSSVWSITSGSDCCASNLELSSRASERDYCFQSQPITANSSENLGCLFAPIIVICEDQDHSRLDPWHCDNFV
jgi:hypothetical protein